MTKQQAIDIIQARIHALQANNDTSGTLTLHRIIQNIHRLNIPDYSIFASAGIRVRPTRMQISSTSP